MKLKRLLAAAAAAAALAFACGAAIGFQEDALSGKLVRLHVVANSDSAEDQALKLRVRDAVLAELSPALEGACGRNEAAERIAADADGVASAARREITASGCDYPVRVSLTKEELPTTEYATFSLPEGRYMSLRVVIGSGEGHNWWCVVFPPVCAQAAVGDADAEAAGLTESEAGLITRGTGGYAVKFRAMELISRLRAALG